ncbi:MAG: hypothetical protein U9N33_11675 [Campylobacterota bacterium]|nr:hypothetical protein [Campylobacterota bacterium]
MKKISILSILLLILLTTEIQAKERWKSLKHISQYPVSAFNLQEGIEYLDVRQYAVNEKNKLKRKSYKSVLSLYRTPLTSFDSKIVKKFHKLTPNISSKSNIVIHDIQSDGVGCHYLYNGFTIDDQGKILRMNMVEDIIGFLGEIDTPAELQAVLWLNNKKSGDLYRKTSKGYEAIIEYEDNGYCKKFKYKATVNKKGEITQYKLLKSKALKHEECIHISWNPCDEN